MGESEGTDELAGILPKLVAEGFRVVAPRSNQYNCIACAAGDTSRWWSFHQPEYWPVHATRSNSIDSLVEVFAGLGFERCHDSRTESGFEKVALYAQQGAWTHAAVQTPHGTWLSKIGEGPVIEHHNPESLAGGPYGNPTIHMRRQAMPPDSEAGPREEPTRMQSQYPKPAL